MGAYVGNVDHSSLTIKVMDGVNPLRLANRLPRRSIHLLVSLLNFMTLQITKNIYFGATLAGRTTNEKFEQWELDAPTRPRFGRNWWFWWPTLRANGGRLRSHENTDINFHWLCLSMWITVFAWKCQANKESRHAGNMWKSATTESRKKS